MKKIIPIYLGLLFLLQGCSKELTIEEGPFIPKFSIEGWIENDNYPYVIITHNMPFFTRVDSAQLAEVIIRWAKVTVSSDEETEVLTLVRDDRFLPNYIYRGTSIRGQVGKRYKLKIEYAGNVITAETQIPAPAEVDSLWFSSPSGHPGKFQLNVQFKDKIEERNFYRIYTKMEKEDQFVPTTMPNLDDKLFNGEELVLKINRGPASNLSVNLEPYFLKGDTAMFKFTTIPKEGFEFWESFQNILLSASNPLMGSVSAVKSNVEGPAVGVWCGYGVNTYRIIAPK